MSLRFTGKVCFVPEGVARPRPRRPVALLTLLPHSSARPGVTQPLSAPPVTPVENVSLQHVLPGQCLAVFTLAQGKLLHPDLEGAQQGHDGGDADEDAGVAAVGARLAGGV